MDVLGITHLRAPGAAAADHITTRQHYRLTPLLNSEFKLSQRNRPQGPWLASGHMISFRVISAALCSCYMQYFREAVSCVYSNTHNHSAAYAIGQTSRYTGIPINCYPSSNWDGYLCSSHGYYFDSGNSHTSHRGSAMASFA